MGRSVDMGGSGISFPRQNYKGEGGREGDTLSASVRNPEYFYDPVSPEQSLTDWLVISLSDMCVVPV